MNAIVLDDGTDRAAWLDRRRGGVSATDVARLARGGANTWDAIRAEKAGFARDFTNSAMQHGTEREPVIASFAAARWGFEHSRALFAAADEPRFIATPDLIREGEVGDIKTTVHDWQTIDEVPGRYIDQVLWQMRVTGARHGRIIFEPHENGVPLYFEPKWFDIDWDSARIAKLESVAYEFLDSDGEPDEDAAVLDALLTDAAVRKEVADAALASYKAAVAAIEEHLDGKPRRFSGSLASLTRSEDRIDMRFDQTRFKREQADLFAEYQKPTPVKGALRITLNGGTDE